MSVEPTINNIRWVKYKLSCTIHEAVRERSVLILPNKQIYLLTYFIFRLKVFRGFTEKTNYLISMKTFSKV